MKFAEGISDNSVFNERKRGMAQKGGRSFHVYGCKFQH